MAFNDIEFIAILFFFACIFFAGLRRRSESLDGRFTGIDLSMSSALKGIACVFILMGHYVSHREGVVEITTFSRIIQYTTANIALAIFMYFSGYGLSLKTVKRGGASFCMVQANEEGIYSIVPHMRSGHGCLSYSA